VHHPLDVGASSGEGVVLAGRQRAQRVGALLDQGPQSAGERIHEPLLPERKGLRLPLARAQVASAAQRAAEVAQDPAHLPRREVPHHADRVEVLELRGVVRQ